MVEIPLATDTPFFEQETQLDGASYLLTFRWNDRQGRWFLSIADADGDPIVSGVAMVVDWVLCGLYTDPRMPPGQLVIASTEGRDPTLEDLGRAASLIYVEASEI